METYNQQTHQTITQIVRDGVHEGWEFVCPICGYRARYMSRPQPGRQHLEILSIGDPQARHVSRQTPATQVKVQSIDLTENDIDESWLTPELRRQWEELLSDVSMGEW